MVQAHPIAQILAHQQRDGYWIKPGAGYSPKYTGGGTRVTDMYFLLFEAFEAEFRIVARAYPACPTMNGVADGLWAIPEATNSGAPGMSSVAGLGLLVRAFQ